MSEYYTVVDDFGGTAPNPRQLHDEIATHISNNPGDITPTFLGVQTYVNTKDVSSHPFIDPGKTVVEIMFDSSLSGAEKTILDGLIAAHVAVFTVMTREILIIPASLDTTKHSTYRRVIKPVGVVGMTYAVAKCISYMASSITSYDIRFFDKTNQVVLLETNLTNTAETEQHLGELTDLSDEAWVLEISARKNGGPNNSKVYLESFKICYN